MMTFILRQDIDFSTYTTRDLHKLSLVYLLGNNLEEGLLPSNICKMSFTECNNGHYCNGAKTNTDRERPIEQSEYSSRGKVNNLGNG